MYQSIKELSHSMRMYGVLNNVEKHCEEALAENLHPMELVRLLLEDEKLARKEATAKRLVTKAKFRANLVLEDCELTMV